MARDAVEPEEAADLVTLIERMDRLDREDILSALQENGMTINDQEQAIDPESFDNEPIEKHYYKPVSRLSPRNFLGTGWRHMDPNEINTHVDEIVSHIADYCEASNLNFDFDGDEPYRYDITDGQQYKTGAEFWAYDRDGAPALYGDVSHKEGAVTLLPVPLIVHTAVIDGINVTVRYDPPDPEMYQELDAWLDGYMLPTVYEE